ncbi:hypothetical protein OS493_014616 [Desmophyllum pertusum]|uniref:Uncharacterized protein n=1 Tax=Desmophyllum pertusum TaxID=174260 RepID=A0A9W9YPZ7_9CNID|nr:hypothetical protein OS493_014616 [Desmophyllum pertusum]
MVKLKCSSWHLLVPEPPLGLWLCHCPRVNQDICQQHEVLGRPVSHIIALRQPNRHYFIVVPLEDIIDICVYMAFSDSATYYAAHFPNHLEKDLNTCTVCHTCS